MPSEERILSYLEELRQRKLRPTLICALVCQAKVALFASNHYPGWEFIQGRIEKGELPQETLEREIAEELGFHFHRDCNFPLKRFDWLFEAQLKTKIQDKQIAGEQQDPKPIAKHFIAFAAELDCEDYPQINPEDFAFAGTTVKLHRCKWLGYKDAAPLIKKLNSSKKIAIIQQALDKLLQKQFIQ